MELETVTAQPSTTAPPAQFLGSFAARSRREHQRSSRRHDIRSSIFHYFTDGWGEIIIWKSAVSLIVVTKQD